VLLQVVPPDEIGQQTHQSPSPVGTHETVTRSRTATSPKPKPKPAPKPPNVLEIEKRLKWKTYEQLQQFLKERRFPQAIALAEALVQRLPEDTEVRQWLAIVYQLWGRALIGEKQPLKARIYLKKALKTDPHNKTLWVEVQRDFQRLEHIF
jgi:tetratricopeptide (TPR) repeat protein